MVVADRDRLRDAVDRGMLVQRVPDRHSRRVVAGAHAGRAHDAHARAEPLGDLPLPPLRSRERAG